MPQIGREPQLVDYCKIYTDWGLKSSIFFEIDDLLTRKKQKGQS